MVFDVLTPLVHITLGVRYSVGYTAGHANPSPGGHSTNYCKGYKDGATSTGSSTTTRLQTPASGW